MVGADTHVLLPQHAALIRESGISNTVAREREYLSITKKIELGSRGFKEAQRNVPALLIPVWDTTGNIGLYQSRPDTPRIGGNGKPIKYETPGRARMCLDVPPRIRPFIGDPKTPLFITEGVRKADSAISNGIDCCLALLGVWNWRGTNDDGGKVALPDWERIALNGRVVYLVFDSDVMTKRGVYHALARLRDFLAQRGGLVRVVYLPAGSGGAKVGLDDFFVTGGTTADLLALATETLRPPPDDGEDEGPYRATTSGLIWRKQTQNGPVETPLTNFQARIVGDVAEDDGVETRRALEIVAAVRDRQHRFRIPAERFAAMNWPLEHLGAGAIVYPGMGTRDHARTAIQLLSGEMPQRTIYAHTGWRQCEDTWVYLHAGGGIGPDGPLEGIEVVLPGDLSRFCLPPPPSGEALISAIRTSFKMIEAAPEGITIPLLASVYRAVLGGADFSLFLVGPTGAGKSELAALAQQHFGAGLDSRHLPGQWASTGNALEGLAFLAKDALLVIDDFAPGGSPIDAQRYHRDAERILRSQGNRAGRQRMTATATLRADKPPRGLVLSTGEDVPRGQSARARALILDVGPGIVRWETLARCQGEAAAGDYAAALSGFVRWVAGDYDATQERFVAETARLRGLAHGGGAHRRTPGIVASLGAAWRCFLDFAVEAGAISASEAESAWRRGWTALGLAALAQAQYQAASEPATRFIELVGAILSSGRAHVAGADGEEPEQPQRWGWRHSIVGAGEYERREWRPQGARVGWVDGEQLYLDREVVVAEVQKLGRDGGEGLTITAQTLTKRLKERGLLASTDEKRETFLVRRVLEGKQRNVLHLLVGTVAPNAEPDKPDNPVDWRESAD